LLFYKVWTRERPEVETFGRLRYRFLENTMGQKSSGSDIATSENAGLYTIRETASLFGLSCRALRFYEERGLLHPIRVRPRSQRLYTSADYEILKKILLAKHLGFSITEIHEMIAGGSNANKKRDLELALQPEQILTQIQFMERQRDDINEALRALHEAYRLATQKAPAKN
jgi:DNA-binding transcriptional MerR regulator